MLSAQRDFYCLDYTGKCFRGSTATNQYRTGDDHGDEGHGAANLVALPVVERLTATDEGRCVKNLDPADYVLTLM